jgi:hypothetical protein
MYLMATKKHILNFILSFQDDYKALAPDENSKVFDGKALYTMGRGMPHGRVLMGNGVVNKASVLVHGKSTLVMPPNHDEYQSVIAENEQLKETNELLTEENGVHRELLMVKSVYCLPCGTRLCMHFYVSDF